MIELVETHCHIQSAGTAGGERSTREKWSKAGLTADGMVAKAAKYGVTRLICVGCDVSDSQLAVDFVQDKEKAWASIGIHPHEAKRYVGNNKELAVFTKLAHAQKVVAIGECGLDYYYGHSPEHDQATILRYQIELAQTCNLPLIFHVREAFDDFWPIFDSYENIRGVLHSFTDSMRNMEKAVERGLYIGVNGIATFTKDEKQREMYKNIPLSSILLETDAPFLTPSPYRGTICEPYHISVVADFLGGLRQEPLQDLARVTSENALNLFRIT